eukprot:394372_1
MDTLHICVLSISNLFAALFFSMTGFGAGMTFQILYWLSVSLHLLPEGSLSQVVGYLTLSQMLVSMAQGLYLRHYILLQPKFSAILLSTICISTVVGNGLLVRVDNILLIRLLGALLLSAFIIH